MTFRVMLLDVLKLGRLSESRHIPIQVPQPFVQRRVSTSDIPDIAFEMLNINGIEADDGCVKAHIRFGDMSAKIIGGGVFSQMRFCAV